MFDNHTHPIHPSVFGDNAEFRPADWWRHLCWLGDTRVALCGDLSSNRVDAQDQLAAWRAAGITHILDVRGEWSDESFVAVEAPEITYLWLGTHDSGGAQDASWFEQGVAGALVALADPDARIVVHCHMGVNRGPSMGFAVLLALGFDVDDALSLIRIERPIAAVLYAEDAVEWWVGSGRCDAANADELRHAVRQWHDDNPVDVGWIIGRIRQAEVRS
jgi:dual specificity phosphatase 3